MNSVAVARRRDGDTHGPAALLEDCMRLVTTIDQDQSTNSSDALAAACLFGIVGGLLFGVAVAATVPAVAIGALLGAIVGIFVAYH